MDVYLLRAERQRIAELFRSTILVCLFCERSSSALQRKKREAISKLPSMSNRPWHGNLVSGCSRWTHQSSRCRAGKFANDFGWIRLVPAPPLIAHRNYVCPSAKVVTV